MRLFQWEKRGLIYCPDDNYYTHASHPCVIHINDDYFIIAFSSRDPQQRSHIFLCEAELSGGVFRLVGKPKLALSPGPLGHFDCDGVLSSSFLRYRDKYYLYYGGWENLVSVPYTANTGRLILDIDKLSLTREFPCPILGRNPQSPIFSGAPCFIKCKGELWAWYTSACKWEKCNGVAKHYYSIRRAVSKDGIQWISDSELAIDFLDEHEYAVARSSIIFHDSVYYLWFAHRATKNIQTYRIGFATSRDGLHWDRDDKNSGIDVSSMGWDKEMICYPHVVEHKGWLYMLYNGNHYGESGFGYAVCQL